LRNQIGARYCECGLHSLRAVRSAVVHGFVPTAVNESTVRRLIEFGRHKLTESERLQPAVA